MSTYTEFEQKLLVAAYQYSELEAVDMPSVGEVIKHYNLDSKPRWIESALKQFRDYGYNRDEGHIGDLLGQRIWLSAEGFKEAERLLHKEGVYVPEPEQAEHFENLLGDKPLNFGGSVPSASTAIYTMPFLGDAPTIETTSIGSKSIDSTGWTGTQFVVTDAKVISQIKSLSRDLKSELEKTHIPSNSARDDLYGLVDALIAICGMAEPEISVIDRITSSPKFKMFASLVVLIATIRSATGL